MKYRQHTEKIFTVEDFLSAEECQQYIALSEEVGYEMAKVNTLFRKKLVIVRQ